MGILDPTASAEGVERKPLNARLEDLDGSRIGLVGNGKQAAEPVLNVVEERLAEGYPGAEVEYYLVDELNMLKDEETMAAIESWAAESVDAAIAAMGDCGSCTKFLSWETNRLEDAGVPAVGLVEEGFVVDYQSNAIEKGRPLRFSVIPVRCEVTDRDRIRADLTPDVVDAIVDELVRPLDENELAGAAVAGSR